MILSLSTKINHLITHSDTFIPVNVGTEEKSKAKQKKPKNPQK